MSIRFPFVIFALAALLVGAPLAEAQTPKHIGNFKDWDGYAYEDGSGKVCFIVSAPQDSRPKNVRRGKIYVMVAHRPKEKVRGEVSIFSGYPYRQDSEVDVKIGGTGFKLFTQGENAWAREGKTDAALVKAMIRGVGMIVRGTSSRGTLTTDNYSLRGFTAAYNAIGNACGTK